MLWTKPHNNQTMNSRHRTFTNCMYSDLVLAEAKHKRAYVTSVKTNVG